MKQHKFIKYCPDRYTEIENYKLALKDNFKGWHCHHRLGEHCFTRDELIKFDLYYNRTPEELIFVTREEHSRLHNSISKGAEKAWETNRGRKNTPEQISRISAATKEAMKDVSYDKLAYWKDKSQSEEQKALKVKKIKERSEAYWKYKAEGGSLNFNDFQKKYFPRKPRGKTQP